MTVPMLRLAPADCRALAQEFDSNLKYGRAFTEASDAVDVLTDCILVVVHPDSASEIKLPAQAVMVTPAGIGIELRPFDDTIRERLREFVSGQSPANSLEPAEAAPAVVPDPSTPPAVRGEPDAQPAVSEPDAVQADQDPAGGNPEGALDACMPSEQANADADGRELDPHAAAAVAADESDATADEQSSDEQAAACDEQAPAEQSDDEAEGSDPNARQAARPRHEQLRNLNSREQHKLARKGELNDRVILERLYGKNVWEPLLHNPRLTVPEVARIARKGTVPRPLLELIVDNNSWIQAPIVRRALLSNPRVAHESIMKLLRITTKHELKTIVKTSTYSSQVREAAKKLLG